VLIIVYSVFFWHPDRHFVASCMLHLLHWGTEAKWVHQLLSSGIGLRLHPFEPKKIGSKGSRTVDFASRFETIIESTNFESRNLLKIWISMQNQRFMNPSNHFFWFERGANVIRPPFFIGFLIRKYISRTLHLCPIFWHVKCCIAAKPRADIFQIRCFEIAPD
jgi:hypothetical protein